MPTPSVEDYLECIYGLVKEKGYARVSDIASSLEVQPSSVTRMIQKLDGKDFLVYEKYRGLVLTPKGEELGRSIRERHHLLESFLRLLGIDEETVQHDVEGMEHHVSPDTVDAIVRFMRFFAAHPKWLQAYERYRDGGSGGRAEQA